MARVVIATAYGGPEVLRIVDEALPAPGRGEVSIAVRAAGVNPVDAKSYAGGEKGSDPDRLPLRIGVEAAGVVTTVGPDAVGPAGPVAVGDGVIAYRILGGYADAITVPAASVIPKPAAIPWETAAAMMLAGTTAIHLLTATGVTDGDTVLLHGAGGGVGSIAAQIAVRDGARVVGTASSKDFDRLRGYGIEPIAYGPGLIDRARAAAPGGYGAALDTVGSDEAIDASLALVPTRRCIATIAAAARAEREGIKALGGDPHSAPGGREIRAGARMRLTALVVDGSVRIEMGERFPLVEVADVHRRLLAGELKGRTVLIPKES